MANRTRTWRDIRLSTLVLEKRQANMGLVMVAGMMVAMFALAFVIIPAAPNSAFVRGPESSLAMRLANQIKPLPILGDTSCQGASNLVTNILLILQDMEGTLGAGFHGTQFDFSQGCDVIVQYVPLLGTYDSLVVASRTLDPNNATSVKVFYEDAFLLSSDFIIMNDAIGYKIAFKATGELNNDLSLATLRSVCGDDCYRVVLSGIHWTIRVYMDQFLCQFESWLSSQKIGFGGPVC